jgi:APA family basic amino acid/polyamine antiporter
MTAYTLYNVGILGLAGIDKVAEQGTIVAFNFFGGALSPIINVLVIISCLGTLNGLMIGNCRCFYSLSVRGEGIDPERFAQVDKKTDIPHNASIFSLMMCAIWFVYFILAGGGFFPWETVNKYGFDSSELPIITLYAGYIPILIAMMVKEKGLNPFKRFVLPIASIFGILIIITACALKHQEDLVWYFIVFVAIMIIGWLVNRYNHKKTR